MSENQASLGLSLYVQHHDCKSVYVYCLITQHKLLAILISSVDDNMSISNVQLVWVSHQPLHLLHLLLREAKDVNSKFIVMVITQYVEYFTSLIISNFSDHSNVEKNIEIYLNFFALVLQI